MIDLAAAEVIISFRDGSEAVGRLHANVAGGTELAAALSGCAVVGYSVTWTTHVSDTKAAPGEPTAGRGVFVFATDQVDEYLVLALPGIDDDLVTGWEIDPAQELVEQFVDAVIDGPWANPFGHNVTALEVSFYEFKP